MIERDSREWDERVLQLARDYLPLRQCKCCGSPRINGYECAYCDDEPCEAAPGEPSIKSV